MLHALVVDDDVHSLSALAELVEAEGFDTATADNLAKARLQLEQRVPDVVLSDLMLPDGRGTELLKELLEEPTVEVILITGKATVETAVEALRLGAFDYLTKPIDLGRLKTLLARVKDTRELKQEVSSLRAELRDLGRFGPMVGTAPTMQRGCPSTQRWSRCSLMSRSAVSAPTWRTPVSRMNPAIHARATGTSGASASRNAPGAGAAGNRTVVSVCSR